MNMTTTTALRTQLSRCVTVR